ncbi:toxin-antitoxin system, toxin component, PIN family [Bifidobacterium gallicum DSM 20093 = LMG 11596]|nr:toxin-antitoxin system, toxin component, PIN family [Bifidobacterium gallicum DSM 20093 = LMG 11596]
MELLRTCVNSDVEMMIAVSSLKDTYYILAKRYGESFARQTVAELLDLFDAQPLLVAYARTAAVSNESDFEDGLVRALAESLRCDAIVTRDATAFQNSAIAHCAPLAFVEHLNNL